MPFKYSSVRARLLANSREYPKPEGEHYAALKKPCRIWQGALNSSGYGVFTVRSRYKNEKGRKVKRRLAHRVSLADHLGLKCWQLNVVSHLCDNRPCIEPEHLFSTTQRKNVAQMIERERHRNGSTGKLPVESLGVTA